MRKIDQKIITTIQDQRNCVALKEYCYRQNKHGNTLIYTGYVDGLVVTQVFLHGNLIAKGDAFKWQFSMCGWPTVTTKRRINALAGAFGHAGIYTKNGKHYSNDKEVDASAWF